ncbi:MAG TPA: branched-chain amino acid ABC transporter permease, partial [Acetobacteraceae bacterium]|nr:branched-chain amino acid ABC transporter permease [Acetobacteraceae bacterium]
IAAAIAFAMLTAGLLGMLIERVAYRPMLAAPRLSILITALAVSMVLENTVLAATGGQIEAFSTDLGFEGFDLGSVHITTTQIVLVVSALLLMMAMQVFISRTLWGKAMRAIAIDPDACRLMGIDVHRVIALTFFVGSALAAAAGVMAGVYYGSLFYFMGFLIGLKAFTAAVIGGIGSIPGAMLGGLVLGLLEAFGTQIQVVGTEWKDVFVFAILILLLVFRPTGLLGRPEVERM